MVLKRKGLGEVEKLGLMGEKVGDYDEDGAGGLDANRGSRGRVCLVWMR